MNKHPTNRLERLKASRKKPRLDEKKLHKEERANKVRRKIIRESLKEQETQDDLKHYSDFEG